MTKSKWSFIFIYSFFFNLVGTSTVHIKRKVLLVSQLIAQNKKLSNKVSLLLFRRTFSSTFLTTTSHKNKILIVNTFIYIILYGIILSLILKIYLFISDTNINVLIQFCNILYHF